MQEKKRERTPYLQWLRILAAAAVVLLHTAGSKWLTTDPTTPQWAAMNFYDSLVRWPVPVFMMITGALFLPRQTPLKRMLTAYIPRIAAAFGVWSAVYTYLAWQGGAAVDTLAKIFVAGCDHLWYLPYLAGVYLAIPFLQRIVADERLEKELMAVSFIIGIAVPWLAELGALALPEHSSVIRAAENNLNVTFFMDCLFLILLGHWLSRRDFSGRELAWLYAAGIIGVAVTRFATVWASRQAGSPSSLFYDFKAPNNLCAAAALFVFAKLHFHRLPKPAAYLAECSFGVYLVHPLVLALLERDWNIHVLTNDPLWMIPALAALVLGLSVLVTAVLKKVPIIGKWIV